MIQNKRIKLFIISQLISITGISQYFPDKAFPELFKEVQLKAIFPDSKIFADAVPLYGAEQIEKAYQWQKHTPGFNLKQFVENNFKVRIIAAAIKPDLQFPPIEDHIEKLWSVLRRPPIMVDSGSLLALPNPYIVPGGRFNEIYYWDSYFTMLGLAVSGKKQVMRDITNNFAHQLDSYGMIPNGNRSYYLTRSQPPFFSLMAGLVAKDKDSTAIYLSYLPQLLKEYAFWMQGAENLNEHHPADRRVVLMKNRAILNRYWDNSNSPRPESYQEDMELGNFKDTAALYRQLKAACESGWDFSSRWFLNGQDLASIHTTDIIPVDLNCLIYQLEQTIAHVYKIKQDQVHMQEYEEKALNRKNAILKYCWDTASLFFTDYDYTKGQPTAVFSLAGVFPLFFKLADSMQVKEVAKRIHHSFLYAGGLVTTTVLTRQQWDAPNGWAPLQYLSYEAMKRNGEISIADTIAARWMRTVQNAYSRTGKLMEKYNVINPDIPGGGGEYPTQDGFGWTNGVYLYFKNELMH